MIRYLFLSLFLFGCTSGCESKSVEGETSAPSPIHWDDCGYEVGDHACDFTLVDQNGSSWNLYSHYGEVIVLDFSTEWCGYCHVAAEETQAVQDEKSEIKDFSYVTIIVEDMSGNSPPTEQAIQRWAEHYSITAPILMGSREMITEDFEKFTDLNHLHITDGCGESCEPWHSEENDNKIDIKDITK